MNYKYGNKEKGYSVIIPFQTKKNAERYYKSLVLGGYVIKGNVTNTDKPPNKRGKEQ